MVTTEHARFCVTHCWRVGYTLMQTLTGAPPIVQCYCVACGRGAFRGRGPHSRWPASAALTVYLSGPAAELVWAAPAVCPVRPHRSGGRRVRPIPLSQTYRQFASSVEFGRATAPAHGAGARRIHRGDIYCRK